MTREEAIQKAVKLLRLSTSSNKHEAALAAQRAQELLDRFEISQAMLEDGPEDEKDEPIFNFAERGAPLEDLGTKVPQWKSRLALAVCNANSCKVYIERVPSRTSRLRRTFFQIIGRASDVEKVRYLYQFLCREVNRLARRDGEGCGVQWKLAYRIGVVETISRNLEQAKREVVSQMRKESENNPQALVKLDNAVARLAQKAKDVEDWLAGSSLRLKHSYARDYHRAVDARQQGRIAGKEINVGNQARGAIGAAKKRIGNG